MFNFTKNIECKFVVVLSLCAMFSVEGTNRNNTLQIVKELVKQWSNDIGKELENLSKEMTKHKLLEDVFKPLRSGMHQVIERTLLENIAKNISSLMDKKTQAVKKISDYAEFLSYHRKDELLYLNGSYYYYNADNVTNTEGTDKAKQAEDEIQEQKTLDECRWYCRQRDLKPITNNIFDKARLESLYKKREHDERTDCNCGNLLNENTDPAYYWELPLVYNEKFDEFVNLNLSVIKTAINVYEREEAILEGVRWSEPLDFVFKDNLEKDPTLTWQYFASPRGFMRHYPAVKWSEEQYDKTYDFRTRSWYTEAMTSPKDIIILMDNSGSMKGTHRALCEKIVNEILDTLNDNDFVNVYIFNNETQPLVECFNNTLVQANEENLRLLREALPTYVDIFTSDIIVGLEKAFNILKDNRRKSSLCNQAIMLVTAGLDYDFDTAVFKKYNWDQKIPVRIFTYQIGHDCTDARQMEWVACANMGYYANMTYLSDVREKMLNYLNVMSRPLNYKFMDKQNAIWSYLHVDLADRRLSNWLWRKFEGNRQRRVFLDHVKRDNLRMEKRITSDYYMLLSESHKFEKYEKKNNYNYMTTISLPVYGRRKKEYDLIGVAGVDVPIKLLQSKIPFHKLGVNGYAFICTNNGYVLMHPDHRTEFENILKPTFNRVDLLEVEIQDDNTEPRLFSKSIVELREQVVHQNRTHVFLNAKFSLYDMKRVALSGRHYYLTPIGPFTLGIVLPDKYGNIKLEKPRTSFNLRELKNWKVHPEWIYCEKCDGSTPEEKVLNARKRKHIDPLLGSLLYDANATHWFGEPHMYDKKFVEKHLVNKIFLATSSGLTRWYTWKTSITEDKKDSFEDRNNRAIDEDWYRRAVEENNKDESIFIYSVPFEISGYENNTMITCTKAVFVNNGTHKTPAAVVGYQFNHKPMHQLYRDITTKVVRSKDSKNDAYAISCESDELSCFILDNNAYIVLSDEHEYTGRYMGDIRPDIMYHLIKNKVYKSTRMFDYQAICQKEPPKKKVDKMKKCENSATSNMISYKKLFYNLLNIIQWSLFTIFSLINTIIAGPDYQSLKEDTIAFERLELKKTYPTPCDHEFWLFTLGDRFDNTVFKKHASKFDCEWPYVVERIPHSNLLFLAINGECITDTTNTYRNSPEPKEIIYPDGQNLPCYIAIKNNYTRRVYMSCYRRDDRELKLNDINASYCGHTWGEQWDRCP